LRLPEEIGNLTNLNTLDLSSSGLLRLPEEIGDLANLKTLNLRASGIASLPPSIGQLKNLKDLNLSYTGSLLRLPEEFGNLASLKTLNLELSGITMLSASTREKFGYSPACGRARSQIESIQTTPNFWPLALNNATRAFVCRHAPSWPELMYYCKEYRVQKPDAIYRFLIDFREQFISILVAHDNTGHQLRGK
jgi:Leucine-rich repeat (LRR) protein